MQNIFWTGYTDKDRNTAISEIQQIVNAYGYITDFKPFSDLSISLKIELEEFKIDLLYDALTKYMALKEFQRMDSISTTERSLYLNVTFIKGTGDVRYEIPAVPG
jgi:ribosomal protein S8